MTLSSHREIGAPIGNKGEKRFRRGTKSSLSAYEDAGSDYILRHVKDAAGASPLYPQRMLTPPHPLVGVNHQLAARRNPGRRFVYLSSRLCPRRICRSHVF